MTDKKRKAIISVTLVILTILVTQYFGCVIAAFGVWDYSYNPDVYLSSEYGEYTLLLTVPTEYADCFLPEGELLDGVGKGKCGKIASVTAAPALSEGSAGVYAKDTHTRLTVLVRGEAVKRGGSLSFGTLTPLPGKRVFLHMPCVCEGICLSKGTEAAL